MYSFMNLQYNMPQLFGSFGNCACAPNPYFSAYTNPISCFSAYPQVFPQYTMFNMPLFSYMPQYTMPELTMPYQTFMPQQTESLFDIDLNNIFKYTPRKSITDNVKSIDYAKDFLDKTSKRNKASNDLISLGYNSQKGRQLAEIARKNTVGFIGYCAKYVKKAIEEAGLGKYESGHAYQCIDILKRNPNFKEIQARDLDLNKLPAGCILVYERGVSGYSSEYGHIEITDGRGFGVSDGTTANIRPGAHVFIPV